MIRFDLQSIKWYHPSYIAAIDKEGNPAIKMPIDFFYLPGSAPCRSVWLTAKAVGVELNLIETQLHQGDHMKPEFLKVCALKLTDMRRSHD